MSALQFGRKILLGSRGNRAFDYWINLSYLLAGWVLDAMNSPNKVDNQLFAIMTWATAFSFAVLGAVLGSLEQIFAHPTLVLKVGTAVGLILGGVLGWGMWAFIRRVAEKEAREKSKTDAG